MYTDINEVKYEGEWNESEGSGKVVSHEGILWCEWTLVGKDCLVKGKALFVDLNSN